MFIKYRLANPQGWTGVRWPMMNEAVSRALIIKNMLIWSLPLIAFWRILFSCFLSSYIDKVSKNRRTRKIERMRERERERERALGVPSRLPSWLIYRRVIRVGGPFNLIIKYLRGARASSLSIQLSFSPTAS